MFGEKYADVVRVFDVPGVSMELCGGTNVSNTAEIGLFKIVGESGVAAGIRRIEAVAGVSVLGYLNERVSALQEELKGSQTALTAARAELAVAKSAALATQAVAVGECQLLVARLDGVDGDGLQGAVLGFLDQLGDASAVVLGGLPDPSDQGKVILVAAFG